MAATEFVHKVGVKPRLVDPQVWVGKKSIAIEALDVVALISAAIAPDLNALLAHGAHQQSACYDSAQGSGVEINLATRSNVKSAAGDCGEAFFDK